MYGFKLIHPDTGNVVIDETYMNFGLVLTGFVKDLSVYTTNYYGIANLRAYLLPDISNYTSPIAVVDVETNTYASVGCSGKINGSGVNNYILTNGAPDSNLRYFIFAANNNIRANGNYGLLVKDANGRICFDSRLKYLKVIGSIYGNAISTPSSNDYALFSDTIPNSVLAGLMLPCQSSAWVNTMVGGINYGTRIMTLFKRVGNKIEKLKMQNASGIGDSEIAIISSCSHGFIIDVTNY